MLEAWNPLEKELLASLQRDLEGALAAHMSSSDARQARRH